MRIIAGTFKGRKLFTPESDAIRPTSDRAREAIFNVLMHGKYAGEHVIGAHVVDLCCGTGALGLEALSRGARMATFVDQDKRSLELTKKNVTHCGANALAHFVQADVTTLPPAREAANLVLLDAPYAAPLVSAAYQSLRAQGWFAPRALLVVEQARETAVPTLAGAELIDERQYGKARMLIYRTV